MMRCGALVLLAKDPDVVWEKEGEGGRGGPEEGAEGMEEEVVERRESRRGREERRS